MVRLFCVLCAVLFLSGCLEDATTNRLLDSLERLSDTLAEEIDAVREAMGQRGNEADNRNANGSELTAVDGAAVRRLTGAEAWGVADLGEFARRKSVRAGNEPRTIFVSEFVRFSENRTRVSQHTRCYFLDNRCVLEVSGSPEPSMYSRNAFPGIGYELKSGEMELVAKRHGISLAKDQGELADIPVQGTNTAGVLGRTWHYNQGMKRVDYVTYGGWLDHSAFDVGIMRIEGSRWDLDTDPEKSTWGTVGISYGHRTKTNPEGNATWTGVMIGSSWRDVHLPEPIQGDAQITYDMENEAVNVSFSDIYNLKTESGLDDMHWYGLIAQQGIFSGRTFSPWQYVHGDTLSGAFYGSDRSDHAEVGGTFYSASRKALGAFGAKR